MALEEELGAHRLAGGEGLPDVHAVAVEVRRLGGGRRERRAVGGEVEQRAHPVDRVNGRAARRAAERRPDAGAADDADDAGAALPQRVLAAAHREVVARRALVAVGGPAVVGDEDEQRALPDPARLERVGHVAHAVVEDRRHRRHRLPRRVAARRVREAVEVLLRRLQRPVDVLEGEVHEEGRGARRLDDLDRARREEVRRVRVVRLEARARAVGKVVDRLAVGVVAGRVRVVVLGAAPVPVVAVEAAARRQRGELVLADVPLTDGVRLVAEPLQVARKQRVREVEPQLRAAEGHVDAVVDRVAARQDRRARRRAHRLRVVIVER